MLRPGLHYSIALAFSVWLHVVCFRPLHVGRIAFELVLISGFHCVMWLRQRVMLILVQWNEASSIYIKLLVPYISMYWWCDEALGLQCMSRFPHFLLWDPEGSRKACCSYIKNPQKLGVATHIHLFGLEWYVYTPSKLIIWVISQNLGAKSRKQDTVPTQS